MTLLIGTRDGLYKSDSTEITLEGRSINALAGQTDDAWILVDGREVWHLRNGSVRLLADRTDGPALTCVLSTPSGVFVGTDDARLRRISGSRLIAVESFDEVDERDTWFTPWGGPPATRSMAIDDRGRVYANVHVGGVMFSSNSGESWQQTALDIHTDPHQVIAPAGQDGLLLAATAVGLATSHNAGESWEINARGLPVTYARAVALSESTILLSVSRGPSGQDSGIYRRQLDGGDPFVRCKDGLPDHFDSNIDTGLLVADGSSVTMATPHGTLYRSQDNGETWKLLISSLPEVRALLA